MTTLPTRDPHPRIEGGRPFFVLTGPVGSSLTNRNRHRIIVTDLGTGNRSEYGKG